MTHPRGERDELRLYSRRILLYREDGLHPVLRIFRLVSDGKHIAGDRAVSVSKRNLYRRSRTDLPCQFRRNLVLKGPVQFFICDIYDYISVNAAHTFPLLSSSISRISARSSISYRFPFRI